MVALRQYCLCCMQHNKASTMRMRVVNACFAAQHRKRHEAPAGRFASTSQLPSTSKRCCRARRNSLWCGKRLQLQQLQQKSQALNGGKQNGGNFHSTYAPWPATAPQQQEKQQQQYRDGRTINLMQPKQPRRLWCRRRRGAHLLGASKRFGVRT